MTLARPHANMAMAHREIRDFSIGMLFAQARAVMKEYDAAG